MGREPWIQQKTPYAAKLHEQAQMYFEKGKSSFQKQALKEFGANFTGVGLDQ